MTTLRILQYCLKPPRKYTSSVRPCPCKFNQSRSIPEYRLTNRFFSPQFIDNDIGYSYDTFALRSDASPRQCSSPYSSPDPTKFEATWLENTLTQPPSSDLSPQDFHVFGSLSDALESQRFYDNGEVEAYVLNWLHIFY